MTGERMLVCDKCKWRTQTTRHSARLRHADRCEQGDPEKNWRFQEHNPGSEPGEDVADPGASVEGVPDPIRASSDNPTPTAERETAENADADGPAPSEPRGVSIRAARTLVDLTVPDFRAMVDVVRPTDPLESNDDQGQEQTTEFGEDISADAPPETLPLESSSAPTTAASGAADPEIPPPSAESGDNDAALSKSEAIQSAEENTPVGTESRVGDDAAPEGAEPAADKSSPEISVAPRPGLAETSSESKDDDSSTEEVPDHFTNESATDGEMAAKVDEPALLNAPAGSSRPPRDLGSLDVVLESADGDESVDSLLLSSADMKPVDLVEVTRRRPAEPPATTVSRIRDDELVIRCLSGNAVGVRKIGSGTLTIGRSEGELVVQKDEFLCPKHAQLAVTQSVVRIADLDSLNGVWVRIRGERTLGLGHEFMVGRQVFMVGAVNDAERKSGSPMPAVPAGWAQRRL